MRLASFGSTHKFQRLSFPATAESLNIVDVGIETIRAKVGEVLQNYPVDFALLFGSQATGTARPDSDVDIAIFLQENTEVHPELIASEISQHTERSIGKPVDVVVLNHERFRLAGRIALEGIPIYEINELRRARYVANMRKRYLDFMQFAGPLDKEIIRLTAEGKR